MTLREKPLLEFRVENDTLFLTDNNTPSISGAYSLKDITKFKFHNQEIDAGVSIITFLIRLFVVRGPLITNSKPKITFEHKGKMIKVDSLQVNLTHADILTNNIQSILSNNQNL